MGRDLIAEKIIQDLEVQCHHKLCDWKGALQLLDKHSKTCIYEKPPEWLAKVQSQSQKLLETTTEKKNIEDIIFEQVKFEY
jgi:hypothetical protein